MMIKNIILMQIQKKFAEKVKFIPTQVEIKINYLEDKFTLICRNAEREKEADDKISSNSDLSDMLQKQLKKKANIDNIEKIKLYIDFEKKTTTSDLFYKEGEEFKHIEIKNIF